MRLRSPSFRRAATLVETGLVYAIVMMLTLGVVIVALGVFRYQQVAALAREGARWASVHGGQYAKETGNTMASASSVNTAIQSSPGMGGLDPNLLNQSGDGYSVTWDDSGEMPIYVSSGSVVDNHVHVTVTYQWTPPLYVTGPIVLRSTSVMTVQY
jgi:hypothetical protein